MREDKHTPRCPLVAHQTAGPFYVEEPIMRRAIAEDQPGRKLSLRIKLLDLETCKPRPGVLFSLFHANAAGIYSGFADQGTEREFDTTGQTWLRGAQKSDESGVVTFETIYPGWYTGRSTHMHFTATVGGKLALTSQIYFPDPILREIYKQPPYRGWGDTEKDEDEVRLRAERGVLPTFDIDGDVATLTLAVATPPGLE